MRSLSLILLFLLFISCKKDNTGLTYASDEFNVCNNVIISCNNTNSSYCLWGFKWGEGNPFADYFDVGSNKLGPQISGGLVSYSIQEDNGFVNTHRQANVPSESFDHLIACAESEVDSAFNRWSSVADIHFEKQPNNSDTDIKIFVANIDQGGVGFPNYDFEPCNALNGHIIIKRSNNFSSCDNFRVFILHEIGHVLGLGHVGTSNVMKQNILGEGITDLQRGDSIGLVQIYGPKN